MLISKSFQKSVDHMYHKIEEGKCVIARCGKPATPGYILCGSCRKEWKEEIRNREIIPDRHMGALGYGFA